MIFSANERYFLELSRFGHLFLIPLGKLPWQLILGKIREMTFIQHAGISKRIQISQFGYRGLLGTQVISK